MKWRKRRAPQPAPTAVTVERHVVEPPSAPEPARVVPERRRPRAPWVEHVTTFSGQRYRLMVREGFEGRTAVAAWRAGRGLPVGRFVSGSRPGSTWRKFGEELGPEVAPEGADWTFVYEFEVGAWCWDPATPALDDEYGSHHPAPRGNPEVHGEP